MRGFRVGVFAGLLVLSACAARPTQMTFLSAEDNVHVASWVVRSRDVTPDCPVPWVVRKARLHGGRQEGVDIVEIDNGKLKILVVPTRGMGIWSVTMGDMRLGWDSPVEEIVHPQFVNLAARGGLGWLEGFGEWMARCGLESNGHPGEDVIVSNTGAKITIDLTLHGKIAYLPAHEVTLVVDEAPPHTIRLRGRVAEQMMFGPNLELVTEISTVPGSNTFRIDDEIINHAGHEAEFQILYHANFGPPLLEEGATFVGPVREVTPFNDRAAEGGVENFARYTGPTPGWVEQVYCLELYGDDDNRTTVLLHNNAKDRGVSLSYSLAEIPYLTIWKNTAAKADGYVTGIEPGTNFPYTRRLERAAGRVPKLPAGGTYHAAIDVTLHATAGAVNQARAEIESIRAQRPTQVNHEPPPTGE